MATALIVLANGFEEIEAIVPIDILRRADVEVTVAGLNYPLVSSARQMQVVADVVLHDVQDQIFDMVVLPGGEPGTTHLAESKLLSDVILRHVAHKKFVAAICAAPRILNNLGVLEGCLATAYPETPMTRCILQDAPLIEDGQFITANGLVRRLNLPLLW